jgi:hypothetical protein
MDTFPSACSVSGDPALTSPWFSKAAVAAVATALPMSTSSKISVGFFPPSSSDRCLYIWSAVSFLIWIPVAVPPVKEMPLVKGCLTKADPVVGPSPKTMLMTPGGNSAWRKISHKRNADMDVTSEGFATAVHPKARQGLIFQVNR